MTQHKTHASCTLIVPQCHDSVVKIRQMPPGSQSITPLGSVELLKAHKKFGKFLDADLDSPRVASCAGRAEVVTTVLKFGLPFFICLNAD